MENLKIGDVLYLQQVFYGTPRLLNCKIAKATPKQYVLEDGTRVKKQNLQSSNDQYYAIPEASFVAEVNYAKTREQAIKALDKLKSKKALTKAQYESIVEFCKQFEA